MPLALWRLILFKPTTYIVNQHSYFSKINASVQSLVYIHYERNYMHRAGCFIKNDTPQYFQIVTAGLPKWRLCQKLNCVITL